MCTRAMWPNAAGAVMVGRNMDYARDTGTNLWSLPRGMERDDRIGGGLTWKSKYGSLVAGADDLMSVDGMNEAGLAGHLLWLAESEYGPRDESRPGLGMSVWLQYMLDNFATVAEAVAWIRETNVQVVSETDPDSGRPVNLHLALEDVSGDSAIIEYLGGSAKVWHDRSYLVMTNSPTFDQQLEHLRRFEEFGGVETLPGNTSPADRFVRASYYASRLPEPSSIREAVASLMSVMRNAAQPFRIPDPDMPSASQTIWQTIADLTNGIYVFESTTRPNIVWVRMSELDLSEGAPAKKLDLVGDPEIVGGQDTDAAPRFVESEPLQFVACRGI